MADYWAHWLAIGERRGAKLPRIFSVNWFRKGADGSFLWPGFGENSRVLAWVFGRCAGKADGQETPIGVVPPPQALDLGVLDLAPAAVEELLRVDIESWLAEVPMIREYYAQFGAKLPKGLATELDELERRLRSAN
jgi:phosphoenolpyruvate carboxykinase (GTP)